MAGALPKLFRYSWGFAAGMLGALASTLAIMAAVFRYIARDAVRETGHCAPEALDGIDVYCQLGLGLARIAGYLNLGAIVIAAGAFFAAWRWSQQGTLHENTDPGAGGNGLAIRHRDADRSGSDDGGGGGFDGID